MEVKEVKGVSSLCSCGPIQGRKVHHIPVASSFNFFNFINFINFRNLSLYSFRHLYLHGVYVATKHVAVQKYIKNNKTQNINRLFVQNSRKL